MESEMLEVGAKAPDFSISNQDGEEISLSNYKGQTVVLYFYPKDSTPGWTTEACEFRDAHEEYKKMNAVVLGVSKDSEKSHTKFRAKNNLPFHLLADVEKEVHQLYGTWVEKKMYGKTYMGTQRATFVIDTEGIIQEVFPKVKPKGHAEQVREVIEKLASK